jgi:hypothetical protein
MSSRQSRALIYFFLAVLLLIVSKTTYARSGCCSHHGGVCGCGCCDGSPLSATCAPYYPGCGSASPSVNLVPAKPTCAANSYYNSSDGKCYCNTGYCVNVTNSGCIKLPSNAHCVESLTDAWKCNSSYTEQGNYCVKEVKKDIPDTPTVKTPTPQKTTNTTKSTFSESSDEDYGWVGTLLLLGGAFLGGKYLNKKK